MKRIGISLGKWFKNHFGGWKASTKAEKFVTIFSAGIAVAFVVVMFLAQWSLQVLIAAVASLALIGALMRLIAHQSPPLEKVDFLGKGLAVIAAFSSLVGALLNLTTIEKLIAVATHVS